MPYKTLHTYGEINNSVAVKNLSKHSDFRHPDFREEVFMRFYEFHLKYASHPGCVYYLMPYFCDEYELDDEQKLWVAYLNGVTQNMCTTYIIWKNFPFHNAVDLLEMEDWHSENWRKLDYDTDRRYQKGHLVKMVKNYLELVGESQVSYFNRFETFEETWDEVYNNFFMYGRLSTFSYLEYLRIMGRDIEPDHLFLDDYSGSMSHRNGLLKVIGRDDLDQHKSNALWNGKDKLHTPDVIEGCKDLGEWLLNRASIRFANRSFIKDVNYFTLESTLCTYKSWYRKNRRYPNVYNDMFCQRIIKAEKNWGKCFDFFWNVRRKHLPKYLRLEDNPYDPGLKPIKQNYFRETGKVLMMDKEFGCFENSFFDDIRKETIWGI